MVKIGSKTIDTNIFLAPMAGCADLSFRLVCREHGARFCFYEMVDSNSLVRSRRRNGDILKLHEKDTPIAGQLLGSDPSMILDAAHKLLDLVNITFLDLNAACPAKKAIRKKAGAYLLRDKATLSNILKTLSASLHIPVTVKLRTGFDAIDHKEISEIAAMCESSGAAAIFVHGRTRAQGYTGEIDYTAIKAVKNSVAVPVFGSGNIFTPELAKRMFDETGCDGIMIARGALGNPAIFDDIKKYFKSGSLPSSENISRKKAILKRHLEYIKALKEIRSSTKVGFMRKVAIWYAKSFSSASEIRRQISRVKSYEEMTKLIDSLEFKSTLSSSALSRVLPRDPYQKDVLL